MDEMTENRLVLRVEPSDASSEVPALLVAQMLIGFQGLIHALGLLDEGRTGRQRFRVPASVSDRYTLSCSPPEKGSFMVSARVTSRIPELFAPADAALMARRVKEVVRAVSAGDRDGLAKELPDSRLRSKALAFLKAAVPVSGSGYTLNVSNGTGPEIPLDADSLRRLETSRGEQPVSAAVETVTGRLSEISFDDRRVTIIYAPASRSLECVYSDDIEPMLFENRRDFIQVTGQVLKDADGHPKKIVQVEAIEELDLSPIHLAEVQLGFGTMIKFHERLSLQPQLSETEQLLVLEYEPLQIEVFAPTRELLWEELQEQIRMLWIEYVQAEETQLTEPALSFRRRLMAAMEVMPHGTR
jgi:hypothetical protein